MSIWAYRCVCDGVIHYHHTYIVHGGWFGRVPALGWGGYLERRINELVNRRRMVVSKRCMIYDRRGLGLTGFIPSASPSVQHLYFTRTCSILLNRTPLLKLSRAFQFQLSRVSLIKNEQGGNPV